MTTTTTATATAEAEPTPTPAQVKRALETQYGCYIWIDSEGNFVPIRIMNDSYLANATAKMQRIKNYLEQAAGTPMILEMPQSTFLSKYIPSGEMARELVESFFDEEDPREAELRQIHSIYRRVIEAMTALDAEIKRRPTAQAIRQLIKERQEKHAQQEKRRIERALQETVTQLNARD